LLLLLLLFKIESTFVYFHICHQYVNLFSFYNIRSLYIELSNLIPEFCYVTKSQIPQILKYSIDKLIY